MFNLLTPVSLIIISVFSLYEKCDGQVVDQPQKIQFTYTLPSQCTTSAGAFKNGVLVRTIWSNVTASAGEHTDYWDGKNDAGRDTTADSIKVLYSDVKYIFGGVIGASSSNLSLRNHCFDLCIVGDTAYVATDYNEAHPSEYKYNINSPSTTKEWIFPAHEGHTGATSEAVCSDGSTVYYAGRDDWYSDSRNANGITYFKTFVYGYKISDGSSVVFSSGISPYVTAIDGGAHYAGGTDEVIDPSANPTGIAVYHNFLFVSRGAMSRIDVVDKTTGALIKTITSITNPTTLKVQNDYLWVIQGSTPTVARYTINIDGTITSSALTLSGVVAPLGLMVSKDGSKIAVMDGYTSQQVKIYNTSTGALISTLGQLGGYSHQTLVSDDRFMFKNSKDFSEQRIGGDFADNGSFLINDIGNYRIQHFDASNNYLNNLQHIGYLYAVHADINDPTRVFAGYVEYKVDYSKTLTSTGSNGSWTLYRNYSDKVNFSIGQADIDRLKDVSTLSNNKTYALYNYNGGRYEVIELADTGLRFTGVRPQFEFNNDDRRFGMEANGDLLYKRFNPGFTTVWVRRPLIGFDAGNNPIYGKDVTIAETPVIDGYETYAVDEEFNRGSITSSGIIATYKAGIHGGPHLGGYPIGGSSWNWATSFATNSNYHGDFPTNGDFDIGNHVQGAGTWYQAVDRNIFDVYRGEFWKANDGAGETNIFNHYYDNGLMVGQFGAIRNDGREGMAGNNLIGTIVKNGDSYYVYHCDEGDYGGIHQFRIDSLNSIHVINLPADKTGIESVNGVDLLAGLTRGTTIANNVAGWTRSNGDDNDLSFTTGARTYDTRKSPDINAYYHKSNGAEWLSRDLGSNKALTKWSLKGLVNFDGDSPNDPYGWGGSYIQVLDEKDKVISQFEFAETYGANNQQWFQGNDKTLVIATSGQLNNNLFTYSQPFELIVNGGTTTFNFAGYSQTTASLQDPTADYTAPRKLRLYFFYNQWQQRERKINIIEMRFITTTAAKSSPSDNFRSKQSGLWSDIAGWQSSADGITWSDATLLPTVNAGSVTIQNGHAIEIPDTLTIDHLTINTGGVLNVDSKATLTVADDTGDDITIASGGSLVIKSDSTSTGRIGKSTGTIKGNVTVERFISAKANASYRLLAPSVTTTSSIKANWQEGTNNPTSMINNNPVPGYGTHITGSLTGQNGFDATADAQVSLFTYNQQSATQAWQSISNTDLNTLDAKKGYLLYVRGSRSIDLKSTAASQTCNTTLRATGAIISGTVVYKDQEGSGRTSLIANPYASPISWTALNATNSTLFENYYTFWDPNIGSKGGYVTVDATGTASVLTSKATTDIQSGQAFLVKAKAGASSPGFTITEDHKTGANNPNVFRTANALMSKLYASLYYTDNTGRRNLADGVLARFDSSYFAKVDGDDAEDVENFDENISLSRNNSTLSIESRPFINTNDTLFLTIDNMKQQAYQWQFDPSNFDSSSSRKAYLRDNFAGIETALSLARSTTVNFTITSDAASYAADRFLVVFKAQSALPVKMLSVTASQQTDGIAVNWKTATEVNMDRYEVEKSTDGQTFNLAATAAVKANSSLINSYNWLDAKPVSGNNYYRIKSVNKDNTFDFSQIVKVFIGDVNKGINVFPNPVKGETFSLQLNNLEKGNYTLQLFNAAGQIMLRQAINHNGGSGTQTVTANGQLLPGTYQLLLVRENGVTYTIKILKV